MWTFLRLEVIVISVIFILLANILIQRKHSLCRDDWWLEVEIVGWRLFINQKKKKFQKKKISKKKNFKKKKISKKKKFQKKKISKKKLLKY